MNTILLPIIFILFLRLEFFCFSPNFFFNFSPQISDLINWYQSHRSSGLPESGKMTRNQELNADIACLKETAESSSQRMNAMEQRMTNLDQKVDAHTQHLDSIDANIAALTVMMQNIQKSLG